ncbi:MAG: hypothetical protein HY820_39240 [Acidobacteria bacterium]|nr:hypothetical protein [Acidobacteriota bacterium]
MFRLLDSPSNRHVVQIFNSDQSRIIDTVLAIPNYRLQPTGDSRFAFWETPPGTAKALRAWFYPGDNFGQEFPYPKQLRQLEVAALITRTEPAPAEVNMEEPTPAPEPAPAPVAVEPSTEETPVPEQKSEPVEIAQNTPAPKPAQQPAEPEQPQATPQPTELPKTASPYPALALIGLLSLASYARLRK